MRTVKFTLAILIVVLFSTCKSANYEAMDSTSLAPAPEAYSESVSSSAAVENNKDTTRKFVRTADLKFKVKSVIKSTYNIEDITVRNGGFVTYTNLTSNIDNVSVTAVSADSSLETTYYTVINNITIRVPNTKLDTTLKEISKNIVYLDYRVIKADDVALQILSNKLSQKRARKYEKRIEEAIDSRGKKLNETTNAEEVLLSSQQQADDARIANLSLADQINFSTITINIYQRQTIQREMIKRYENIDEYEPGFGSKLLESVKTGWNILEAFIVFIVKLWGLVVFAVAVWVLYKLYWHKLKKFMGK